MVHILDHLYYGITLITMYLLRLGNIQASPISIDYYKYILDEVQR